MYKPFFSNNLFSYIEFLILFIFFIFLLYKNISKINIFYMNRFRKRTKITILLLFIPLHSLIYVMLDKFNINSVIGIAINSFMLVLIVYLTISVFFGRK